MLLDEIDLGVRCDAHTGHAFPPRCYACQDAAREEAEERASTAAAPAPVSPSMPFADVPRPVRSLAKAAGRVR